MIIDESGSIALGCHQRRDERFRAFVASLKNTGSKMSVAEFSTVARLPSIGGLPPGTYVTIDDTTKAGFETYIQGTNRTVGPMGGRPAGGSILRPPAQRRHPHLVVFLTDGDPTAAINNSQVTMDEYMTKVPLAESEVRSNISNSSALTPAIPNANGLKAEASHILASGVGEALQNHSRWTG